jgi:hypothetical protein
MAYCAMRIAVARVIIMRTRQWMVPIALVALLGGRGSFAQTTTPEAAPQAIPTDNPPSETPSPPWPRVVAVGDTTLSIYEPQAERWDGARLEATSAVTVHTAQSDTPSYGVVHLTARTDVDKGQGLVSLHDVHIASAEFPGASAQAETYRKTIEDAGELTSVVPLARIQAGVAAAVRRSTARAEVQNTPPRIIVSQRPAVLVLVDGPPVPRPVEGTSMSRVVNTRALILRDAHAFYLHVGNGWLQASAIEGPWSAVETLAAELDQANDAVARSGLVASGDVDLLVNADPSTAVYVSTTPAEVLQTDGPPEAAPLGGTDLWYLTNTSDDIFVQGEGGAKRYFVLLSGRWFEARSLDGPWRFIAANQLPPDFARISRASPKANVLSSIPGTPEAREALIANQVPETASIPRENGPTMSVSYDGAPRFAPIESTSLAYATNTATPVIEVEPSTFYALRDGVWFAASAPTGPWVVATSVPPDIYTIPTSNPLHYVTNVYIDGATPGYVYEASTPGYLGTVAAPSGVVVYGTGYDYSPWIGNVWYGAPVTFGLGVGLGAGFGFGLGFRSAFASPWFGPRFVFPVRAFPHRPRPVFVTDVNVYNRWRGAGVVARAPHVAPRAFGGVPQRGFVGGAPRGIGGGPPFAPPVDRRGFAAPPAFRGAPFPQTNAPGFRSVPGTAPSAPFQRAPAPAFRAPPPGFRGPAPAPGFRGPAPAPGFRGPAPAPGFRGPAPAPGFRGPPAGPRGPSAPMQGGGGQFRGPGRR